MKAERDIKEGKQRWMKADRRKRKRNKHGKMDRKKTGLYNNLLGDFVVMVMNLHIPFNGN
jgi:hypothetical protein